jgi:hypothetical protein
MRKLDEEGGQVDVAKARHLCVLAEDHVHDAGYYRGAHGGQARTDDQIIDGIADDGDTYRSVQRAKVSQRGD